MMIKVFTSGHEPETAGNDLTHQFESWVASFAPNTVEIESVHTNSNKWGWMLTITYKINR
jgi:hypothetical protein